jgi:Cu-Zn family superoxide dismutase
MKTALVLLATGLLGLSIPSTRAQSTSELIAVLGSTKDSTAHGIVTFTALPDGKVKVSAHVEGLEPGTKHGFHIHQFGDISAADGMATGGHYNPGKHDHALPDHAMRHAGDFGNIEANDKGVADLELVVDNIALTDGADAIIGRGVIVHAKPDDGSQPTGNAGARIAQGVIGVKNNTPPKQP